MIFLFLQASNTMVPPLDNARSEDQVDNMFAAHCTLHTENCTLITGLCTLNTLSWVLHTKHYIINKAQLSSSYYRFQRETEYC